MTEGKENGILLIGEGAPSDAGYESIREYYREYYGDVKVSNNNWIREFFRRTFTVPDLVKRRTKHFGALKYNNDIITHVISDTLRKEVEAELKSNVFYANRYGKNGLSSVFREIQASGVKKLLVIPLSPFYLPMSYETSVLKAFEIASGYNNIELNLIPPYYEHKDFIKPLELMIRDKNSEKKIEHLHFVFKAIKEEQSTHENCDDALPDLSEEQKQLNYCFQAKSSMRTLMSRIEDLNIDHSYSFLPMKLGKGKYLQPSTNDVLKENISRGIKDITVISPTTIIDNVETLHDIDVELKKRFIGWGGEKFNFIPSLNAHPEWIEHIVKWADEWMNSYKEQVQ